MLVLQLHFTVGNAFLIPQDQDEFSDYDRIEDVPQKRSSSAEVAYSRHEPLDLAKLDENGEKGRRKNAKIK